MPSHHGLGKVAGWNDGDHRMQDTPTTLPPSPSEAPWNPYLILTWFLILNIESPQVPQGNGKLGPSKSRFLGSIPNPPLKSCQSDLSLQPILCPE